MESQLKVDYIKRHDVVQLFENMVSVLLEDRPDRPVSHLLGHFNKKTLHRRSTRSLGNSEGFHRQSTFDAFMGDDPPVPPQGIYGGCGASQARRSIAMGLGMSRKRSEWGSMMSGEDCTDSEADMSDDTCDIGIFLKPNNTTDQAALCEEVESELRACVEDEKLVLNLYEMQLTDLMACKGDMLFDCCTHITTLDLSYNYLKELPEGIGNLVLLETLRLSSNQLSTLPDAIGNLAELAELHVEQNQLTVLPQSIVKLNRLRVMQLDWNDLEEFPAHVCELEKLQEIYLIENPAITSVPVEALKKITMLVIAIDNMPSIVTQFKNDELSHISVNYNKVFPDKILPGLYLGSLRSAQSIRVYQELNINYLATVGRELQTVLGDGMHQIQLMVDDLPGADITVAFAQVHAMIDEAISNNQCCLVHCFKGQSRSASCVISYIISKFKWSFEQAEQFVRDRSPRICPNPTFVKLLQSYAANITKND